MRAAKVTVKAMLEEAAAESSAATLALAQNPDDARAIAAKAMADVKFKWAVRSQARKSLENMVKLASTDPAVAVKHDALDADGWVLNVANATIDLRTMKARSHQREDLLTKVAPVKFDPAASCPIWDAFLARCMGGDVELTAYLRRIVGYALTGSTREHILAFFFGGGANGKSTFLTTIGRILCDYAGPAARGLLFRSNGDRHPTELAALHGKRFVVCAEIDASASFDEALVKDLTGGDVITARRMREDFWSFEPTHKLFVAGNHRPMVRGDDDGIWRRLRLVPFTVTIPTVERDKLLGEKLLSELSGIFNWALRGCAEWQRDGLGDPPAVLNATDAYREESDTIGEFFRSRLTFEPEGRIARKGLRVLYELWSEENGYAHLIGPKKLAERLRAKGVTPTTTREGARVVDSWKGVRESSAEERARGRWGVGSRDLQGADPGRSLSAPAREKQTPNQPLQVTTPYTGGRP